MSERARVLFLCTGNSCRSQMAEGWLRHLAPERFVALSAGTDPVGVNPRAVATMAALGVDIAEQRSEDVRDFLDDPPELVIAVCERAADSCPSLPGATHVLRWPFPDPAEAQGDAQEVLAHFRAVSLAIRERLEGWLAAGGSPLGSGT